MENARETKSLSPAEGGVSERKHKAVRRTKNLVLTAMFTAIIVAGAYVKVPIPYVPFTLQTMFTALAGVLLGHKWGTLSVVIYVALGLLGVPVFAYGGGFSYIFMPTFGYMIGFIFGTFVTGLLVKKSSPKFLPLFAAALCGILIIYAIGVPYFFLIKTLYLHAEVSAKTLILSCFLVTLPGDILSCAVCALLGAKLLPLLKRLD